MFKYIIFICIILNIGILLYNFIRGKLNYNKKKIKEFIM